MSDPAFSNVILLLNFDGQPDGSTTFTDLSNQGQTVVGSALGGEIDTAKAAAGSGSLLSDLPTRGVLIGTDASAVNDLGTGEFTIEFFFNKSGEPFSFGWFICNGDVDDSPDSVGYGIGYIPFSNDFQITLSDDGNGISYNVSLDSDLGSPGTAGFWDGNWHHMALTRDSSGDVRFFLDGVGKLVVNSTIDLWTPPSGKLAFPGNSEGTNVNLAVEGNYDSLRITKGVARYTADFTPPDANFPSTGTGGGGGEGAISTVVVVG
jgi:hypothetical protein